MRSVLRPPKAKKNPQGGGFYFWWPWSDCIFPCSFTLHGSLSLRKTRTARGLFSSTDVPNRSVLRPPRAKKIPKGGILFLVALVGLEPTLIAELDFESSASTNSATGPKHKPLFLSSLFRFNFFYQAGTAIRLVCRLLCRGRRFANLFFNGFFNRSHLAGQT